MDDRPLDPTGTTAPETVDDSGRAGLADPGRGVDPGKGLSRRHGTEGGHDPDDGSGPDEQPDDEERELVIGGVAATSEIGDPRAQDAAEDDSAG